MGDMADWANDDTEDLESLRSDYHMGNITDIEAYNAGIIDELGGEPVPYGLVIIKVNGPGQCPVCKGGTHLVRGGKFGPFWGCNSFPKCKGSRGY